MIHIETTRLLLRNYKTTDFVDIGSIMKDINAIYGNCDVQNVSSWKLLERLGFQRIGQFDNQSYKNDKLGNPILFSTFLYELDRLNYKTHNK